MRPWFKVTALADSPSASIDIFERIGKEEDDCGEEVGISFQEFVATIRPLAGRDVTVNVDCPGGSCEVGLAIYDELKKFTGTVTVNVLGTAASIASIIILAGTQRTIAESGRIMIHRPSAKMCGDADQVAAGAAVIKQFEERMVAIYTEHLIYSETEIRAMMQPQIGTWFFGEAAVKAGFVQRVNVATKATAFRKAWATAFTALPTCLFDTLTTPEPQAPAPPPKMKSSILALAALAGINIKADATEAEIEAAITAHKPSSPKFEMNLEDPETKKLFDTAVSAGIPTALREAVTKEVKPLEDKITAQAAEITKLTALITNGVAGGAAGGKPVEGARKPGEQSENTMLLADFNKLPHAERNSFMANKGKLI